MAARNTSDMYAPKQMLIPAMPTTSGFFEIVNPMAGKPKKKMNSVTIIGTPRRVST